MDNRCNAARSKQGYWTCDHRTPTGRIGCRDCRRLARDAEDTATLADWNQGIAW